MTRQQMHNMKLEQMQHLKSFIINSIAKYRPSFPLLKQLLDVLQKIDLSIKSDQNTKEEEGEEEAVAEAVAEDAAEDVMAAEDVVEVAADTKAAVTLHIMPIIPIIGSHTWVRTLMMSGIPLHGNKSNKCICYEANRTQTELVDKSVK